MTMCHSAYPTYGAEEVNMLDYIHLDSIHAFHHGRCYDATGPHDAVAHLEKAATAHHVDVHDGKCKDAHDCRKWRGLDVCRSGDAAAAWGGDRSVHGSVMSGGLKFCVEMTGDAISNGSVDEAIEKHVRAKHPNFDLHEGKCAPCGAPVKHLTTHGIDVNVYAC